MTIIQAHVTRLTIETKDTLEDILEDITTITREIREGERKGDTVCCEWYIEDYTDEVAV